MGKKQNNTGSILAVVAILALVVAVLVMANGGTFSFAGPGADAVGECSVDYGETPQPFAYNDLDDNDAGRATTAEIHLMSGGEASTVTYNSTATSTTASVDMKSLACDQEYVLYAGDSGSSGEYYQKVGTYTASGRYRPIEFATEAVGTVGTYTVKNSTGSYAATEHQWIGTSGTGTFKIYVQEGTADAYYGVNGKIALCAAYPTNNITKFEVSGGTKINTLNKFSAASGDAIDCWEVTANLKDYSDAEFVGSFTAVSGVNPGASGNTVNATIYIMDYANQVYAGDIEYGYADITNSATDLHGTDITMTDAIFIH